MSDNRSGSTLLENILSKSDECFSVGELAMLKGHLSKKGAGEKWNWNCSCGFPFNKCIFWSPILERTYQPNPENFFTAINWKLKSKKLALNVLFPFLFQKTFLHFVNSDNNQNVISTLNDLYKIVSEQSGKKFIIDSSKNPIQALAVYKNIKDFDVKIIWLKRDLRAIVTSKNKWKDLNKKKPKSLLKSLLGIYYYKRLCYTTSTLIKPADILTINYESLAQTPSKQLQRLFKSFEMQPFPTPEYMMLSKDHTIGGTPNRFTKKQIQYDDSWKDQYKKDKFAYFIGGVLNKL